MIGAIVPAEALENALVSFREIQARVDVPRVLFSTERDPEQENYNAANEEEASTEVRGLDLIKGCLALLVNILIQGMVEKKHQREGCTVQAERKPKDAPPRSSVDETINCQILAFPDLTTRLVTPTNDWTKCCRCSQTALEDTESQPSILIWHYLAQG